MWISLNWLSDFCLVKEDLSLEEWSSLISLKIAEVENIKQIETNTDKDILFEIDNKSLTHRPDLWGHYGFAREISSIFQCKLKPYTNYNLEAETFKSPFTIHKEFSL